MTRIDQFKKDKLKSCVIEIIVFLLLYILAKAAFAGSISMVLAIFLCFPPVIYCVFLEEKLEKYHEPSCRLRILTGAGAGLCAAAGLGLYASCPLRIQPGDNVYDSHSLFYSYKHLSI